MYRWCLEECSYKSRLYSPIPSSHNILLSPAPSESWGTIVIGWGNWENFLKRFVLSGVPHTTLLLGVAWLLGVAFQETQEATVGKIKHTSVCCLVFLRSHNIVLITLITYNIIAKCSLMCWFSYFLRSCCFSSPESTVLFISKLEPVVMETGVLGCTINQRLARFVTFSL